MLILNRSLIYWTFPLLVVSGSCNAQPECDSIDTRSAVLQFVSNDRNNQLKNFAATQSAGSASKPESDRPLYQLGQRIVTTETSKDKLTLKCSGGLSASVGNTKATKEITFTVQQSADGELSVSVDPFQFGTESQEGK